MPEILRRTLVVLVFTLTILSLQAIAFDTAPHSDLTRTALAERGFSEDAIKIAQVQNWLTDYYSSSPTIAKSKRAAFEKLHFDNLYNTADVREYWSRLIANAEIAATKAARDDDPTEFLTALGITIHAVQDFYAHSNWVETHPRGSVANYRTETFLSAATSAETFTGKYPADRKIGPNGLAVPAGAAVHGGYADGINHDSPVRPGWDEAYVFAYAATHEIVAFFEKWSEVARPGFRERVASLKISPENRKKLDFDVKAAQNLSMWIDVKGANGHWKGDKSGSTRFFNSFTSKWVGKNSSVYVKAMTDGAMPETLAAGLYEKSAVKELPKTSRFALARRALLVRTTLIRETDDVGRLEPNIDPAGRADFYAVITVAGQIYRERVIQEQKEARDPWFTIHFVDAGISSVPISLNVFDEDDWDPDGKYKDDEIDINKTTGRRNLDLLFRVSDGSVTGDLMGLFNTPATAFTSTGQKPDKNRAQIEGYFAQVWLK